MLTACSDWEAGVEFHYSYTVKAKIGSVPKPPTTGQGLKTAIKKKLPKVTFALGVKIKQP